MARARRMFSEEFKQESVRLMTVRGVSMAQAARDLSIHVNLLRTWMRTATSCAAAAATGRQSAKSEQAELTRLRKEVTTLWMERDILDKCRVLLCQGVDVKFGFVAKHRGTWPVGMLSDMLGVSAGGFYARTVRPESARARADAALAVALHRRLLLSDRTYRARRLRRDVRADGFTVGLHQGERVMRAQGLRARPRRRALPADHGVRSPHAIAPNLLDRDFAATAPNQKWVADFTYLWTTDGWLYVAVVLDLYSRRAVGWSMQETMTVKLVTDALMMAVWRRGAPPSDLESSDQGSQYTSEQFQRVLDALGITCNMSRSGNVWYNAVMGSFFSSLKTELTARKAYATRDAARADVF